jgi:spore coat polysaccharide biosynthesis protein SpsF (cytidylyltransferase family)
MSVVGVVQARFGSTRLPGKVLLDVGGASMLARTVRRLQRARLVDAVAIATSTSPQDDAVERAACELGVMVCRGSESDVLARYAQAACESRADVVVRVTSDCPLLDPGVVDLVVAAFRASCPTADYASNTQRRTYPRGLDVEVFSAAALARADREARTDAQREHVTPYFYQNPTIFRLVSVTNECDLSDGRWTVDTAADLAFARAVYARLPGDAFGWREVLRLLHAEPRLADINRDVVQKQLA